jgi:hypothetical protein
MPSSVSWPAAQFLLVVGHGDQARAAIAVVLGPSFIDARGRSRR